MKANSCSPSPLPHCLVAAKGPDLASLKGCRPNGGIVREVGSATVENAAPAPVTPPVCGTEFDEIPLSDMPKPIAQRLFESKATVPHFYLDVECRDGGKVLSWCLTGNTWGLKWENSKTY
jgi:pyruvate dehydrogenase E2 component (dihydrolipoamide acetyltransferase)